MKDERALENEPLRTLYLRMVIPAVAAQLINLAYNIVDRIFIGHIPGVGELSLAGVGICFPIISTVSAFAQLGGVGGAARFSFYLGKGNKENADKAMISSFTFLIASGLLLTLLVLAFCEPLLILFGASAETLSYAASYLRVYALGTVFVEVTTGMVYFITAEGFAHMSLISVILGAGLNIVLDPVFIYLFNMGVKGAAIATVISQIVSLIFVLNFLCGKKTIVRLNIKKIGHVDMKIMLSALALGLSPFVMQSTESLVNICFNRQLLAYGGVNAVGAMTIFSSIMSIVVYPLMGIGQGVQPIIGFNYGAGNSKRLRKVCFLALGNGVGYSIIVWILIKLVPIAFVNLFSSESAFTAYAVSKSGIFFDMLWIMGIQVVTQNMFVALGNAKNSLILALLRKVILLAPLIYIVPMFLDDKVTGIFLAEPIADTLAAVTTIVVFMLKYRKILFISKER